MSKIVITIEDNPKGVFNRRVNIGLHFDPPIQAGQRDTPAQQLFGRVFDILLNATDQVEVSGMPDSFWKEGA